jgi:hypothetical protein
MAFHTGSKKSDTNGTGGEGSARPSKRRLLKNGALDETEAARVRSCSGGTTATGSARSSDRGPGRARASGTEPCGRAELARAGLAVPAALFDHYALAGRHWVNTYHDRLRPVAELGWVGDRLVFLEENQCVVFWGVRGADLGEADPAVWQGVNVEPAEWYPGGERLCRFLMATDRS